VVSPQETCPPVLSDRISCCVCFFKSKRQSTTVFPSVNCYLPSVTLNPISLYEVKSNPGIAGNECADAPAKYQACHGNILPDETTIHTAGPGGNPFVDVSWLAVEEIYQQGSVTGAPQHGTRIDLFSKSPSLIKISHALKPKTGLSQLKDRVLLLLPESASTYPHRY